MNEKQKFGHAGEDFAAQVLGLSGYEILARNYRCREGEIDIVARREGELFFIEVKTRRDAAFGQPCEAVDRKKQQRMRKAAAAFLAENRKNGCDFLSFQVIEIGFNQIENAF